MGNLKKVTAVLVAGAIMITSMATAFAAAPTVDSGAEDSVKTAVAELSALNIVAGKEDGKFHESDNLTRDEFAKMLVVALNLDNAAKAAQGATRFSDVAAERWSSGYINVAVSRGLIYGRPDGTFGPADEVTYAEAIAMTVRALGYKDAWLDGSWPSNVINKADEVGMLSDLTVTESAANRGAAAVLLKNALTIDNVVATGFGKETTFEVKPGVTMLANKLNIKVAEGGIVSSTAEVDGSLKTNQVVITGAGSNNGTYDVADGVDAIALLGMKGNAWINKDNKVIYFNLDQANSVSFTGTITSIANIGTNKITITDAANAGTEYTIDSPIVKINNAAKTTGDLAAGNQFGTFIKNSDGKIRYMKLIDWTHAAVVVTDVDAANNYIKGYEGTTNKTKIDLSDKDGVKVFGAVNAFADIKANDVVYTAALPNAGKTYYNVYVIRNVVSGSLDKTNTNTGVTSVTVAGKDYSVAGAIVSLDNGNSVTALSAGSDISGAMTKDVSAYLDGQGKVKYLVANVNTVSTVIYGVVTDAFVNNGDRVIKMFNTATDATVTYAYDNTKFGDIATKALNNIVAVTLDKDGKLSTVAQVYDHGNGAITGGNADNVKANVTVAPYSLKEVKATATAFNSSYDYATVGGTNYYVTKDTLILNATNTTNPKLVKWDDIKDKTPNDTVYVVYDSNNIAKLIAFTDTYSIGSAGYSIGVVTSRFYDGNEEATIDVIGDTSKTVKIPDANIAAKDIILYSTDADGNVKSYVKAYVSGSVYIAAGTVTDGATDTKYDVVNGTVKTLSNGILTLSAVANTTDASITADTALKVKDSIAVYVLKTNSDGTASSLAKGSTGDILDDTSVRIILNSDGQPTVIIVKK